MSHSIKIAPSVLAADFTKLGAEVQQVVDLGADQIHIDVMDGRFVPNISMGALVVKAIRRVTDVPLDVHLMIVEPDQHLEAFAKAGANALTVHVEACTHLHRTLSHIRDMGLQTGVAINPHTPASAIKDILHLVDIVVVMTVNPGFGGQAFISEMLPKITAIRQFAGRQPLDITVDGGINEDTALQCLKAGANVLVAGSSIFKAEGGIQIGMENIQSAVKTYQYHQSI